MDIKNKIGFGAIILGGIIIVVLLAVLLFYKPSKEESKTTSPTPNTFRGPTSPPHVEGPEEPPPQ